MHANKLTSIIAIFLFFLMLVFLSACTKSKITQTVQIEKKAFPITIKSLQSFSGSAFIHKTGKLESESNITIKALNLGTITSIKKNIGDLVHAGDTIMEVQDSTGRLSLQVSQAKHAREQAKLNFEQTKALREQKIFDLEQSLISVRYQQTIYDNSGETGTTQAKLQQLQQQEIIYQKQKEYESLIQANQSTIQLFFDHTRNFTEEVQSLYENAKKEIDSIVGTSHQYKQRNDLFEKNLGVRNKQTLEQAKTLTRLMRQKEEHVNNIGQMLQKDEITSILQVREEIQNILQMLQNTVDAVKQMLTYTDTSHTLSATQLESMKSKMLSLEKEIHAFKTKNTQNIQDIKTFFDTYKQKEQILSKAVNIANKQYETLNKQHQDTKYLLYQDEKKIQHSLEKTKKQRNVLQESLRQQIEQYYETYQQSLQEYQSKYLVQTPISGIIISIFEDIGQQVQTGTPLVQIKHDNATHINISLSHKETEVLIQGETVFLNFGDISRTGTLQSITPVSDDTFMYQGIITFSKETQRKIQDEGILGQIVNILLPIQSKHPLVPISILRITDKNIGILQTRDKDANLLIDKHVSLGNIWGEYVEIKTKIDEDINIVTSNTQYFNATKHIITISNTGTENRDRHDPLQNH